MSYSYFTITPRILVLVIPDSFGIFDISASGSTGVEVATLVF